MEINKELKDRKQELLAYFRERATEYLALITDRLGSNESAKASAMNTLLGKSARELIATVNQLASSEGWSITEKLESILLITYCNIVVMIESRNSIRKYEYMDFSRRVGELWDPFCKLCFYYPVHDIKLFVPPLFSDVKKILTSEIVNYINSLNITAEQKKELENYYGKVWMLVTSGEIQLELDLHFISNGQKYVVDFKSGFGSNEKGNTNRLLLVASIYQNLEENYKCLLFVRAEQNNNYLTTLKRSGIWDVYSGEKSYDKIKEFSGYDLKSWTRSNINWAEDFLPETTEHFTKNNLLQYLLW